MARTVSAFCKTGINKRAIALHFVYSTVLFVKVLDRFLSIANPSSYLDLLEIIFNFPCAYIGNQAGFIETLQAHYFVKSSVNMIILVIQEKKEKKDQRMFLFFIPT